MPSTFRNLVDTQATSRPDSIYLIDPESGESTTFWEIRDTSIRISQFVREKGIEKGERVLLFSKNGFNSCRVSISIVYGGFCLTPINTLLSDSGIRGVIEHSDARIIFVEESEFERLSEIASAIGRKIFVVTFGLNEKNGLLPDYDERGTPLFPVEENDDALLIYTSGTTGNPKGVLSSNRAVVFWATFVRNVHELKEIDRSLAVLPISHISALSHDVFSPFVSGGSLVLPNRFSVSRFWKTVEKFGCTWANIAPVIIAYLLNSSNPKELWVSTGSMRFCRSATAPLPVEKHREFEAAFGVGIVESMGMTEATGPVFTNPMDPKKRKIGSPGKSAGNEAKIVDENGNDAKVGTTGEIYLRWPSIMKGYYKNVAETGRAFTEDGWFKTGDLWRMDEDGYFFIVGRSKELIIKGGENIFPRELDEALMRHPSVLEASVVGIPDEFYWQEIMACVIKKPGEELDEDEIRAFMEKEVGKYRTPKIFHFVKDLPRGASGKIQRLKLLDHVKI